MATLFSAIANALTKTIILGALLPATVFVLVGYLWLFPMLPVDAHVLARLEAVDSGWKLASLGAIATAIAALLHLFNTNVIRLYEGYPWRNGPIGKRRADRYKKRMDTLHQARVDGRALMDQLDDGSDEKKHLASVLIDIANELTVSFPDSGFLLPTRFGNAIRSFETYPWAQYRIAGVPLWPHFVAKADKDAGAIDDAKTSVDVAINFSFLLGILALSMFAAGFLFPIPFASGSLLLPWIVKVVVLAIASYLAYVGSIRNAHEWGVTVRSIFDRYRWDVLKDLGVTQTPADLQEERALWFTISMQISRGDPPDGPAVEYKPQTHVEPRNADVTITRGATVAAATTLRDVTIIVHNNGDTDTEELVLCEPIPSGSQYIWGSMKLNGTKIKPDGLNPYRVRIGKVEPQKDAVVTYQTGAA